MHLMKPLENVALFDMDGTLADYQKALQIDYNKIKSPNDLQLIDFDNSQPKFVKERIRLIRNQEGWWRNLPKYNPGFEIFEIAKKLEYTIMILTKGPSSCPNAWTEKTEWVNNHLPGTKITITDDKGLVYGKVLVDDYPGYIERWLEWRPRGLVIMPTHKHNKNFAHPNVIRYDGKNLIEVEERMKEVILR
jgi:5'-nucleotidase